MRQAEEQYSSRGLQFVTTVDNAEFTQEAADSVIKDLFFAIILVALTMLLFLHSLRNALFVSIAIPLSLVPTFIIMYLLGFSLNLMSLLALTLVVGIPVDDAIVVIENIHRHTEMGKNRMQAAYDGIREIGSTIVSISLTLVVVFVPISVTQSLISDIFRQFALTVAVATLFSLLVSFTVVPLLYSRFGKKGKITPTGFIGKIVQAFDNLITATADAFSRLLHWSFSHKSLVFAVVLVLLAGSVSLILFGFIGSEMAPIGTAIVISLLLVYLITVLLYNSYVYPFVVLFSIPLAIIGAFLAIALTMETLNLFTLLGLLALIGLVAKNAILVVDFTNQLKAEGMELKAALPEAARKRFRPIVMTTPAMVVGMLPIALAQGAGAEWKNGIAWVIIDGLTGSMFLTLVVVPLVYYLMDKMLMKFGWNKKTVVAVDDK